MAPKIAKTETWSVEEKAAMKEAAAEAKRAAKRGADNAAGEADLLAKIAEMPEPDRSLAARIHEIVKTAAPALASKTWYGMPAYTKDGKTICFFQAASKFNVRYATFGFQPDARLDDGAMWANAFAVLELTPEVEEQIASLVKRAAS
ncbi:MAG TPA: DUF1801 domain-containing protein [Candidatus Nanopelagicales bacterium]|nr:DUF1801 domain-containing protein [Candidatus Nanopelagicales bacterium]